ncbi:Polysaccharide pyruvyl transferase family protein WcaK [Friedmanniella luteola]|uniref:Polysaccharide pyruvyl transferase family protein WcaK n=1 Tax=Friedmanniella luteola TaxID=546871 RepID=A0A1H1LN63_9ACTN|nr:polysaccharide pyruvyl transferase family protein [Friedmanniella luteola]SDR76044.1 Polysaccharide pyruvyl transferase family protein WcaK [Friedmanniella luteola]
MRVLVIWADDRSPNLGVRVLGAGTEALTRRVWPDAEFVFYNYGARTAPVRLGSVAEVAKEAVLRQRGLADWFRGFDLVMDTRAGDSFADIYGLKRLSAMCATTEFAARVGVPVVLSPQTIGPFGSRRARALAQRSLRTASVVMARDSISAQASADLGRPVDVLTTDVVFALDVPEPTTRRDVVLNVSGLLWQPGPHVDAAAYRRTVTDVHDRLVAAGRTVSLLAHVLPSDNPDDDVPAVEEFRDAHAPTAEVLVPMSLTDIRTMLAGAELVIGSRMHACLNALSVGTPAIPLAYSRKFAPLMADLGWEHVVDLRTSADEAPAVVAEIAARDDLRAQVVAVRERAASTLALATGALAGRVDAVAAGRR